MPNAVTDKEFYQKILEGACLVIEVSDKYGDYGLVGALIFDLVDEELILKSLFLSCRILGREIEYTIIKHLAHIAKQHKRKQIKFLFKITEKNIPAITFLEHLGGTGDFLKSDHLSLSINELDNIKPIIHFSPKNPKVITNTIAQSNDYMLEIAKIAVQSEKPAKPHQFITVEYSLLELLKKHELMINTKKDLSFVELGLNSLNSVLVASSIYRQFSIEISPFELLKPELNFTTLNDYLFSKITANQSIDSELLIAAIDKSALSLAQKQLWDDEQIFEDTTRNHMFVAYEIEDNIDAHLMEKSFSQLIKRHDSLRFSFFSSADGPVLKLNPADSILFNIKTFVNEDPEKYTRYVKVFRAKLFNLAQAPLFRVSLIKKRQGTLFLFCIHHIIHDGWSLNLLMEELSVIYNAYLKELPLCTLDKPLAYLPFIRISSPELLEQQRFFWQKQLLNMPKLDLVYDKTRIESYDKALNKRIPFKLNLQTSAKLKKLAINNQATLYTVLSSAFGVFLSHYADQNDINFITAVSGRNHPLSAKVIGLFSKLSIMRMIITDEESFSDLVRRNKKLIDELLKNQDIAFNELIQLTGEALNSKVHAFNQAGFIFQSYPIRPLVINSKVGKRILGDDKAELIYDACEECRFGNIVCFMQEYNNELHGLFEFNTTVFDKKRIEDMIHSFTALLKHISEGMNQPARAISLLSVQQKKRFISIGNQFKSKDSSHHTLLHYFSEQVKTNYAAIAVIHNHSHITYGYLDKCSNQLARTLKKEGIGHESPVGIFLDNGINRIISMLAILKAGGCYVPLEIELPIYRLENTIKDAELLFIITDSQNGLPIFHNYFPSTKAILIDDSSILSESCAALPYIADSQQLAYLMYTSGSTGKPKGIAIEQRGILSLVKSTDFEINSSDCIAQTSNFLFDAATFEIWGALLNGASLILIDKNSILNAEALNACIKEKKISIMFLTTQLFHAYAYLAPYIFQNLKYLIVGGEAVSHGAVKELFNQKNRPLYFINGYGPTENTTFSTLYMVKSTRDLCNPIPIGKPLKRTQAYVLDPMLNPRPIGAPGKLYLGGIGLARGYLNQEQLNKEKFIDYRGERLYDTGDIVTWKADGNLKYLGRKDNQMKINGHRIEIDEIEAQLTTHRLVRQAIVLIKNENNQQQLVAYILLQPGIELKNINLNHYLKARLPQYMLPLLYYQIEDIPLTIQGKVDKKILIEQENILINYTDYVPPSTKLQKQLITIYADLSNTPSREISISASFFDLGGNSISALHLIDKINKKFNVKMSFSDLYYCADISRLSEKINTSPSSNGSSTDYTKILKLVKTGRTDKTPIIFIHPIGGTGFCYLDLIKLLPEDQPCYLIQDPSIDADEIFFEDIISMAAYYNQLLLQQLKAKQFILAGYSFGGMLSLEMAHQLEKRQLDDHLSLLVSFDTWVISKFLNTKAKEALRLSIMKKYKEVANQLLKQSIDPKPWMELYYRRLQNLGFAYNPPVINKKIILFKASQQLGEFSAMSDASNYLDAHTRQGVDIYSVSGNHDTLLQYPHVKDIGRLLSQYLKD